MKKEAANQDKPKKDPRDIYGISMGAITSDRNLSGYEKLMLCLVASMPSGLRKSNEDLGEHFGIKPDTVTRLISSLRRKGYVTVTGTLDWCRLVKSVYDYKSDHNRYQADKKADRNALVKIEASTAPTMTASTDTESVISPPENKERVGRSSERVGRSSERVGRSSDHNTTNRDNRQTTEVDVVSPLESLFKKEFKKACKLVGGDLSLLNDVVEYSKPRATSSVVRYAMSVLTDPQHWYDDKQHWTIPESKQVQKKKTSDDSKKRRQEKERQKEREQLSGFVLDADPEILRGKVNNGMCPRWLVDELRPEVLQLEVTV